jgi:hypothetical protein
VERSPDHDVGWGIGLALLLHLLQIPLAVLVGFVSCLIDANGYCWLAGIFPPLVIAVSQVVYVVPALVIAVRRGRRGLAKGIAIGAAATFMLNAACFGMLGLSRF